MRDALDRSTMVLALLAAAPTARAQNAIELARQLSNSSASMVSVEAPDNDTEWGRWFSFFLLYPRKEREERL